MNQMCQFLDIKFHLILIQYMLMRDFEPLFLSPQLGISNRTVLIDVESNTFQMKADLVLDSKNFSENTTSLIDEGSPPNVIR